MKFPSISLHVFLAALSFEKVFTPLVDFHEHFLNFGAFFSEM